MVKHQRKEVQSLKFGIGLFASSVWWDGASYWYDGPVSNGPKEVRTSSRGPNWRGKVADAYVKDLLRRLGRSEVRFDVTYAEPPAK